MQFFLIVLLTFLNPQQFFELSISEVKISLQKHANLLKPKHRFETNQGAYFFISTNEGAFFLHIKF
jgi:hypothetical protein